MKPHPELTDRQEAVLRYIVATIEREQRPPTVREIMTAFGYTGPSGPACHIEALQKKGYVAPGDGRYRGLRVARLPDGRAVDGCRLAVAV